MLDSVVQRNNLISAIEKARNSAVISYVLHDNAVIADDALPQIYDKLQAMGRRERIDLVLYARNGVLEVCWRLLNMLREHCDHLGVIVGTRAQGAGALLALGADEIVMGPLSELGSVEAMRKHPLLPNDEFGQPIPISFGEIKSLMDFLSKSGATEGKSGALSPEVLSSLFGYVHPLAIANLRQAETLGKEVTRKALRMHMHSENETATQRLVDLFNGGFHSPMYTVGQAEAQELGLPVTVADQNLWTQVWTLAQLYQEAIYKDHPDAATPGAFYRHVCIIETIGRTTGLRQSFTQSEGQERVLQIRWETAIKGPGPGPSYGPEGMSRN